MGEMEKKSRMTLQKKLLLGLLDSVGVLAVGLVTLRLSKIVDRASPEKSLANKYRRSYSYHKTLGKLISDGLVKAVLYKGKPSVELTEKGKSQLELLTLSEKKKWDMKWRVLIFDIPEHRKATREKIRRTLQSVGFYRIQDSVWVIPYDCEDLVTLLKTDLKVGKELLYMIVDSIEGDAKLKQLFKLSI